MVNSPLIRPYFLGGGVALGGCTLDSHDFCLWVYGWIGGYFAPFFAPVSSYQCVIEKFLTM